MRQISKVDGMSCNISLGRNSDTTNMDDEKYAYIYIYMYIYVYILCFHITYVNIITSFAIFL